MSQQDPPGGCLFGPLILVSLIFVAIVAIAVNPLIGLALAWVLWRWLRKP